MDYKVRLLYRMFYGPDPKTNNLLTLAKETVDSMIKFKRLYPTRKCVYWAPERK